MTKIAGSGSAIGSESRSGSISQRHESADPDPDPDPHKNVMDPNPQHWKKQCCGNGMFIPDPNFSIPDFKSRVKKAQYPGSGSATKSLKYFEPNKLLQSSRKYDPGCLPRCATLQ
jgi:hypothetical protein